MRLIRAHEQPFVPASHEDPRRPGVLKRVIATRDEMLPGRPQMINWAKLPAGQSFRAHYHEDMEETFVIVRGRAEMHVGEQDIAVGPGDTVVVAPREVHSMHNAGTEDVEYLVVGISLGQNGRTIVVEPLE
jgi:mannose-6-phosphate isomerase-like protein (cupin superfamily)